MSHTMISENSDLKGFNWRNSEGERFIEGNDFLEFI